MPAATLIEIGLEKYDWQLRRKYSWKKWLSKGGESSGRKVANPREGILMAIVATFVKDIYFSGWFSENSCTADSKYVPNLGPTMYLFYTTGLRSWNMAFLGVRSPNPLPKASGLGNLTSPGRSQNHNRHTLEEQMISYDDHIISQFHTMITLFHLSSTARWKMCVCLHDCLWQTLVLDAKFV